MSATATIPVLTPEEQALGYTITKEYNPIKKVFDELERKQNAQKADTQVMTIETVKKIQDRVSFLEGRLAQLTEEFQTYRASRK